MKVMNIDYELGKLTEPALKGLAFEAERHGSFEDQALWRGIAEHAKTPSGDPRRASYRPRRVVRRH